MYDLYQVYGGKQQYREADLDEIAAFTMVWWAKRNGAAELQNRQEARWAKAMGG